VEMFRPSRPPDHFAVNGTTYTAMQLHMELRKHINDEDICFGNVSDGCDLYSVLNEELPNALVPGHTLSTVCTANRQHMASLFGMTIVPSFLVILEVCTRAL
jgi:hypothetical protein